MARVGMVPKWGCTRNTYSVPPQCQINHETGEARSILTSEAVACCRKLRSQATWLADVLYDRDPLVTEFISQGVKAVNEEASSEAAKIIKWVILDNDFSVGSGELGE